MSLRDRFVVGEVLRDGPIRSYAARDVVSGRQVVIHLELTETTAVLVDVALAHEPGNVVLEQGVENNVPFVIVEKKQPPREDPFLERRVWKATEPVAEHSSSTSATGLFPVAPAPAAEPEATRLLQAVDLPAKQEQPALPPPVDASSLVTATLVIPVLVSAAETPVQTGQRPPEDEPGEFTRMFRAPLGEAQPAANPVAPPPPAPKAPADGSEFTRLFLVPAEKPQTPAPAVEPVLKVAPPPVQPIAEQQAPSAEPGEFTRMFQTPVQNAPANPPPPATPTIPISHSTSVFQTPNRTSHPVEQAPPKAQTADAGEFTSLFKTPAQIPPNAQPFPPAAQPAPPPAPSAGAGEFTALFRSPAPPPPSPNPEPPPGFGSNQIFPDVPRGSSGAQAPPSSFTQFFQSPAFPPPQGADSRQAAPLPFVPYDPAPPAPAPSGYGRPSGGIEATGVFQSSRPQQAQFSGGASEYTRMFSTPAAVPFQQESKPASPPPAPEPAKDNTKLILIVIGSVILLIVILLIVYFVWFR